MGRPFTIQFSFHEQPVTALVHFDPEGADLTCSIHYINREIGAIIPGQELKLSLATGLADESFLQSQEAEELIDCTAEAIASYLMEAA